MHICGTFSESVCARQLQRAVEVWEPRVERVPLHAWLHPWLPMLPGPLADMYPGIRFKLATALQQWHPSDGSAKQLLSPWQSVQIFVQDMLCPVVLHFRSSPHICSLLRTSLPNRLQAPASQVIKQHAADAK